MLRARFDKFRSEVYTLIGRTNAALDLVNKRLGSAPPEILGQDIEARGKKTKIDKLTGSAREAMTNLMARILEDASITASAKEGNIPEQHWMKEFSCLNKRVTAVDQRLGAVGHGTGKEDKETLSALNGLLTPIRADWQKLGSELVQSTAIASKRN